MAKLDGGLSFKGKLGALTAYRMKGVGGMVLRTAGGAAKERIRADPGFARTRENCAEFGGCSKASKNIRMAMCHLARLADHNISGGLNKVSKMVQKADTAGNRGERSALISACRHYLQGFSLNRGLGFDGVVRQPLYYSISREGLKASLQVPELVPGINFHVPGRLPLFSITAMLGTVPDMAWPASGYQPANKDAAVSFVSASTGWAPTGARRPGQVLELALPAPVKNTGCAKIHALA